MAAPFRGFLTSRNGSSVNFLGDGTIFWGEFVVGLEPPTLG